VVFHLPFHEELFGEKREELLVEAKEVAPLQRKKPDGSAWFYAVIQDAASTEIVCIASPGTEATPAPEWVKQMLKIK
jgi:hypothetical protein